MALAASSRTDATSAHDVWGTASAPSELNRQFVFPRVGGAEMTISLAHELRAELAPLNDAPLRVLRDELLFRRGQAKTHIYQIEAGTIAVYETRADGSHSVVEFAFAGDAVGLGFLENHSHSAQAIGEARVRCLPLSALDHVLQHD